MMCVGMHTFVSVSVHVHMYARLLKYIFHCGFVHVSRVDGAYV